MTASIERREPGVQLYTLRTLLEEDFEGTLQQVAEIGYRDVELHNFFGRSAREVRSILDEAGLTASARHVGLVDMRDQIAKAIDETVTLGCTWLVCPYVQESDRTIEGYRRVADGLNEAAEAAKAAGIGFAYHNHDFEFAPIDGIVPYDLLLEKTSPELVKMEIDFYWVAKAGASPQDYFDRSPGRFSLCHVKDMASDGQMTEVGFGTIDFETIFSAGTQAGIEHYYVEHDHPAEPMESVRKSYPALHSLLTDL
jgi:sugar phosphate isomerase/epimerase